VSVTLGEAQPSLGFRPTYGVADPFALKDPEKRLPSIPLVTKLRHEVADWRARDYDGISQTTRRLLEYWFFEDHLVDGQEFRYYFCQREAIETIIYVYEVLGARRYRDLMERFSITTLYDPTTDRWLRLVSKLATGAGKTKVMSMAVVWSYFHKQFEPASPLAQHFVIVAPNLIVLERLRQDFGDRHIFKTDPLIPPEWAADFDMTVVLQDEAAPETSSGVLYLSNIQRLYEKHEEEPDPADPIASYLGNKPKKDLRSADQGLFERVAAHADLMVLNDEGHHVHDEELRWNQTIDALNTRLKLRGGELAAQLDFTATPKHQNGNLFKEVIIDYPLAQAIEDRIVKRPYLGRLSNAKEGQSPNAAAKYRMWIQAGVRRWRDYVKKTRGTYKPILFIMTESTKAADEVADALQAYDDLKGAVLTIHTNAKGDISERSKELDELRRASREIDAADSPYKAVVSVLMLREGWDVKNVTVIVGLRAYSAAAKILPEQTVGRGLRRVVSPLMHYDEQLDIIGTKAFEDFVLGLEDEGVRFGDVNLDEPPRFETIFVDPDRTANLDIDIPQLSPVLYKSADALSRLTADDVEGPPFPMWALGEAKASEYLRYDILSKELVDKLKMDLRRGSPGDVISFFAEQILKKASFPAQFHLLAPVVKEYVTRRLFLDPVDLDDRAVLDRLTDEEVASALIRRFVDAVNKLGIDSKPAEAESAFRPVSGTPAFQWTGATHAGKKTVFNLVACDSGLEARLAKFLDLAPDVAAYAKNVRQMRFSLDYVSSQGFIRYYYPDFLLRLENGLHYLVETKGAEGVEVALKDARARRWAADVTRLTGQEWRYLKLPQAVFEGSKAREFAELVESADALAASQPELIGSVPDVETGGPVTVTVMTPEIVRAEIERFERQYGIGSNEFLRRFQAGEFDEPEAIDWEWACELADEMGIPHN